MKNKITFVVAALVLSLGLTSCGSSDSSGSTNLVCASIESYLSTKALSLLDAAQGGTATEAIDAMVGTQVEVIELGSISRDLFDTYLSAMNKWAAAVDEYQISKQSEPLTAAALELESEIDSLAPKCESNGWRFESGWRG